MIHDLETVFITCYGFRKLVTASNKLQRQETVQGQPYAIANTTGCDFIFIFIVLLKMQLKFNLKH